MKETTKARKRFDVVNLHLNKETDLVCYNDTQGFDSLRSASTENFLFAEK